ncbi:MAG: mannose-6-phosphate isomerase, class I [Myxococcota bacterium]
MLGICLLENPIRHYPWGSHTAIARLQRRPSPTSQPEAELWMGAHPAAPSRVRRDDAWLPLTDVLRDVSKEALGPRVSTRFGSELPFLFKLLAASEPLSIQAHPDAAQARDGFERENAAGVPLEAPNRNYRDPHPKPELICALTPFWALHGFRSCEAIAEGFRAFGIEELAPEVDALQRDGNGVGHQRFFASIMNAGADRVARAISQAVLPAVESPTSRWFAKLACAYPQDVGALAPLLLNVVRLEPGEAIYLGAGELHSYLEGVGIEIMANSDNVLRGGLTPKHVDVPELSRTLTFESGDPVILRPVPRSTGECVFETPAPQFELAALRLEPDTTWSSGSARGPEIWLVTEGDAEFSDPASGQTLTISQGESVFIPDCVDAYQLAGVATLYRACVPR